MGTVLHKFKWSYQIIIYFFKETNKANIFLKENNTNI